MNKEKTYFIGGINGVGKTTLIKEIGNRYNDFEVVRGSQCFMQWLGIEPGDYVALRSLPDDFKDKEMDKMMKWLLTQNPERSKHLLFDAHFLNIKQDSIINATGDWIGMMDALLVVTANNDEILTRIKSDEMSNGRTRPIFRPNADVGQKLELLKSYQEKTLEAAKSLSLKYCLPLIEIRNQNGKIEEAVNNFINFHQSK